MATPGSHIAETLKGSKLSLPSLRQQVGQTSGNDQVTVQNWQVSYANNQLVESCVVTPKEVSSSIAGVGLLVWSADGETLYCEQYTPITAPGGVGGIYVSPSVGTALFNPQTQGAGVLGVVFGEVQAPGGAISSFFFEQTFNV
jgi:hypothetical protein